MEHLTQMKRKKLLVILGVSMLLLALCFPFLPFAPPTLPPQSQLRESSPAVRKSIALLAERWRVPEDRLGVLSVDRKWIRIINPYTYASAEIWAGKWDRGDALAFYDGLVLVNEYIPKGVLERLMVKNFYTFATFVGTYAEGAIVTYVEAGFPFGKISANSPEYPVLVETVLTVPWTWHILFLD